MMTHDQIDVWVIVVLTVVVFCVGMIVGVLEGRHKERVSVLKILREVGTSDRAPHGRLYVIQVMDEIHKQLRKAWYM